MIGLARSTWQYRRYGRPSATGTPVPHVDRDYPNRLTDEEISEISALVNAAWEQRFSVEYAHILAWDCGVMLGSLRSWYRIAERMPQTYRPVTTRPGAKKAAPVAPVVLATAPLQAWVWDITDLPSMYRSVAFKAYVIQDLYSRKIVGYRVEQREVDDLAADMFKIAFAAEGSPGTVHADSGAAMKSNAVREMFASHEVTESHSRPRVSNDNAHKESEFRTMKKRPDYPGVFATLEHARAWVDQYVVWFNTMHRHTGIARFTPDQVHNGTWRQQHAIRERTLAAYHQSHPERFRSRPKVRAPDETVGINAHHQEKQKIA